MHLGPSSIPATASVSRLDVGIGVVTVVPLVLALGGGGIVGISALVVLAPLGIGIRTALVLAVASILATLCWTVVARAWVGWAVV